MSASPPSMVYFVEKTGSKYNKLYSSRGHIKGLRPEDIEKVWHLNMFAGGWVDITEEFK